MSVIAAVCLAAAISGANTLALDVSHTRDAIAVQVELVGPLPGQMEAALPSGAVVRVRYPLRVRAGRRLWWDRRIFRGEMIVTAAFDPLTGRYRCEQTLDEVIVGSIELDTAAAVSDWLRAPPPVHLSLPEGRWPQRLTVRARAVFTSSTTWLVFPSVEGTDWVEVPVELGSTPPDAGDE